MKHFFSKKLVIISLSVIAVFIITTSLIIKSIDENQKRKIVVDFISTALSQLHYNPVAINDDFSKKAFGLYIKRLDYNKRYFLQGDIKELQKFESKVDDELITKKFNLYSSAVTIWKSRVVQTQEYYREILSTPFDFDAKESYESDPDKLEFSKNEKALKDYWRKMLKYQAMIRLKDMVESQDQAKERKDTSVKIKTFEEMEAEAREKLLKSYNDAYSRMNKMTDREQFNFYLNSIIGVFDPHSDYMPPNDKENFDISMSGKLEGIGATLQETNGFIKVVDMVPGSPSWIQGELQINDLILKVAQGENDPVDIVDMRIDEAVKLIRGKKGTEVRLTIKKVDGAIKTISIIRDVVVIAETYAKSAMLDDNAFKVGYIYLPKFYVDFNDPKGRSCATDVEKEIEKIKKENPQGIILDLRSNGGGSLMDVVKMGGLFIKDGPIVQVNSRYGAPNILRDTDPKIQYDGPLIIMINEFSASASEILAAAMQDYKRAIIVGEKSFGKGTVQRIIEIDEHVPSEYKDAKPLGALKLTIQKFYRINGGSTQVKGVEPDVRLSDIYSYIDMGEKDQDYAMAWTEIAPVTFQQWTNPVVSELLKQKSAERVKLDSSFRTIEQKALSNKKQKDETISSLNFKEWSEQQVQSEKEHKEYLERIKKESGIKALSLIDDVQADADTATKARTSKWLGDLQKDVYLKEAIMILKDMK